MEQVSRMRRSSERGFHMKRKVVVVTTTTTKNLPTSTFDPSPAAAVDSTTAAPTPSPILTQSASPSASSLPGHVSSAAKSSQGIPAGVIAGIALAIMTLFGGLIALFIRKRSASKRQKKRATWGGGFFKSEEKGHQLASPYSFKAPVLSPPPMTYNNLTSPSTASINTVANKGASSATVRCTFIPNLPDELSITLGESVRVLAEYDDGWALCTNGRSEQGMVPLECLEQSAATNNQGDNGAEWRNLQRASSLKTSGATRY